MPKRTADPIVTADAETQPKHQDNKKQFDTIAITGGFDPSNHMMALTPPIVLSSTFKCPDVGIPQLGNGSYCYARLGNPTKEALETSIACVENGKHGMAFSSGMNAITSIIFSFASAGSHVLAGDDLYGGTNFFFNNTAKQLGITVDFLDMRNLDAIKCGIKESTKVVYFESMTNPLLHVADIAAIVKTVKSVRKDIVTVVDNTFFTPYLLRPLDHGIDIVIHSATKYINGHSDTVSGLLSTNRSDLLEKLFFTQITLGGVPSPFDSYLVHRGLKTLHLRMPRHGESALKIATWLESRKNVEVVFFPGLPSHPDFQVFRKQTSENTGLVTFKLNGDLETTKQFLKSLKLICLAVSLGGYHTLIEHPASMTHANLTQENRDALGISDNLIRMSVGLESVDDLIIDLEIAFDASFIGQQERLST